MSIDMLLEASLLDTCKWGVLGRAVSRIRI